MKKITECLTHQTNPWSHYLIDNIFEKNTLDQLLNEIPNLNYCDASDPHRKEFNINKITIKNNPVYRKIVDGFLCDENISFFKSIDDRFSKKEKLLRISIWQDYNGFHLPIHPDAPWKLSTMQIYLPTNDEKDYGTAFYDECGNYVKTTDYKINSGYLFFPNINGIKTNHGFEAKIKNVRTSILFNIMDAEFIVRKKGILKMYEYFKV